MPYLMMQAGVLPCNPSSHHERRTASNEKGEQRCCEARPRQQKKNRGGMSVSGSVRLPSARAVRGRCGRLATGWEGDTWTVEPFAMGMVSGVSRTALALAS